MKRILVDYKKLSHEIAALLLETYPDGYGDTDIISFKNSRGEYIQAVELKTSDTLYMVKISQSLTSFISNFDDNIERELNIKIPMRSDEDETDLDPEDAYETEMELNRDEEFEDDSDLD